MNYWIAVVQFVLVFRDFMACKLATFIVAGLNNTSKRKNIFNYLKQKQFYLIFFARNAFHFWYRKVMGIRLAGEIFWSLGNSKSRRVVICISLKTGYKIDSTLCDTNGRYIAINASINDIDLTLVSMYGPNKDA